MKINLAIKNLILAMRPKQFTKNFLVFSAPLFSFNLDPEIWINAFFSLISFCLISGSMYLINDSIDYKNDRLHPIKKYRIIASGKVSTHLALFFAFIVIFTVLILYFFFNIKISSILFIYVLIQLLYSFIFKRIPIIELFFVSSGFILRTICGGFAAGINLSPWFLISVGLLAFFLIVEKRKGEMLLNKAKMIKTRNVLSSYSLSLLDKYETVLATGSFLTYALWASGPALNGANSSWMLITVPVVLMGIFRYQLLSDSYRISILNGLTSEKSTELPEQIFLKDNFLKIIILLWTSQILIIGFFTILN